MKALNTSCDNQITLCCDGREEPALPLKVPRGERGVINEHAMKREEKEQRVESLAKELEELHGDRLELNETQYRLWARMIVSGIHASKDEPPQVPLITGVTPKRKQSDTFKDTIMHTANAVMKAVTGNYPSPTIVQTPQIQQTITQSQEAPRVSPGRLLKSVASLLISLAPSRIFLKMVY